MKKVLYLRTLGNSYTKIGEELGNSRQYTEYHDEKHKEIHKRYVNKEKQKEYSKKWKEAHVDYFKAYCKSWYLAHKKTSHGKTTKKVSIWRIALIIYFS